LNRRPHRKLGGVCLGGIDPCDFTNVSSCQRCSGQRECPGDPTADPLVLNGECVLVTQLSDDQGTGLSSVGPRLTRQGLKTFYSSKANQTGVNPDASSDVIRFDRRAFDKNRPGVLEAMTQGGVGQDFEAPAPSVSGRYVVMESTGDPLGTNPDGNREIFVYQPKKNEWVQVTFTESPVENRRPATTSGRRFVFDSNGDLNNNPKVQRSNADGNREIFSAKLKKSGVEITQITDTQAPVENISGATDSRAKLVVFSSTGDLTQQNQNPEGNPEIFTWFKGTFEQLTHSTSGESVNPSVSTNGRWVVFESTADLMNNGASNRRIFQYDRFQGVLLQLSRSRFGDNRGARTRKRRFVVWQSTANLTGQNPNGDTVIFLFDRKRD
jgi:WD40-like Beta Propeller Repeat